MLCTMQEEVLINPEISPTFPVNNSQQASNRKKRGEHKLFPTLSPSLRPAWWQTGRYGTENLPTPRLRQADG